MISSPCLLHGSLAAAGAGAGLLGEGQATPPEVGLAHVHAQALGVVGIASRSASALSEADSQAAEAAVGPPLVVFSGGTAFNSVAGARHQLCHAAP